MDTWSDRTVLPIKFLTMFGGKFKKSYAIKSSPTLSYQHNCHRLSYLFHTTYRYGSKTSFKHALMTMFLVMPDQETGAVGRILILVEFWNVPATNAPLLLMWNNLMKMDRSQTLSIASVEAAKVSKQLDHN